MKITLNKSDLLKALAACVNVIQKKSIIPIIDNVLIESDSDSNGSFITLRATNLSSEVNYRIPLNEPTEFTCLVPCMLLFNTVRLMTDETIQMALKDTVLNIKTKKGVTKINGHDISEFVVKKFLTPKETFSLKSIDTFNDIKKATTFIGVNDLRPVLGCLSLKLEENSLTIASMTSYYGVRAKFEVNNPYNLSLNFLLQKAVLQPLLAIDFQSSINIGLEGDVFTFSSGNLSYACNIYSEQAYPNIEPIFREKSESFVTINPMELKDSLSRILNFSNDDDDLKRVKINANDNFKNIEMSSDGYRGSSKELNEVTHKQLLFKDDYPLSITVAGRYLQVVLDSCIVPSCNFYFKNLEGVYNKGIFFDYTSTNNGISTYKEFVLMPVAE